MASVGETHKIMRALLVWPVRRIVSVALASCLMALTGCAEFELGAHATKQIQGSERSQSRSTYKVGQPYQVAGVWYYPQEDPNYDETGIASWYGAPFHGQNTANGEQYDQNALTAAHKTLPMPSFARVTNLENGRSIIVRINDRGPFVNGRIIDLSRRSAQLLAIDQNGTARVRVQAVNPSSPGSDGAMVARASNGIEQPKVAALPRGEVTAEALPPPPGVKGQAGPQIAGSGSAAGSGAVSSVALAGSAAAAAPSLDQQAVLQMPVRPTNIYVQVGAFTQYDNANRLRARLAGVGPAKVTSAVVKGTEFFRVRIGPLQSVDQADGMLDRVIGLGQPDAHIVVD
ncbi:MAG TPA: septal ring lytic transglycosylase RlpA family protein [Candidatus Cybelea sp.]|nr:septal ring lytic transglycosylase RlpA family protein [Candidatus Cybelea sp.]